MDFIITAIRICERCEPNLKKGLKDEWYLLSNRVHVTSQNKLELVKGYTYTNNLWGKGINISAIVGSNGSGKSSLLEILYRIINNLSAILQKGKQRKAAETLYYINGLCADVYYIVDNQLFCISCKNDCVSLLMPNTQSIVLDPFDKNTIVPIKDFIEYARNCLFYTIVTNYSLQAFISQDFEEEKVFLLKERENKFPKEGAIWLNSLFHKNDGYMVPIVLNPFRHEGIIDMKREHHLSIYRLSSCFIHARNTKHNFITKYKLHQILYRYNENYVKDKIQKDKTIPDKFIWEYVFDTNGSRYVDRILILYGFTAGQLNFKSNGINRILKDAALYLVHKTLDVASKYPIFNDKNIKKCSMFEEVQENDNKVLEDIISFLRKDKSHITVKIRQVLHFLRAYVKGNFNNFNCLNFTFDEYVELVGGNTKSTKMSEIQEFLPPTFFNANILLDHFKNNKEKDNTNPIPIDRLSAGERQYLYTFSTYIYHVLNLLSIQSSSNVKYRRFNLILDEVEICFHPEYQRCFVFEFVEFIKRLHLNTYACFNIIIVTHSPFVLSDIPSENILWLKEGKQDNYDINKRNPFAANVNDILRNSFFLEKGFIGEFTKRKILSLIKFITGKSHKTKEWDKKKAQHFISLIGEPILKEKLNNLLESKLQ